MGRITRAQLADCLFSGICFCIMNNKDFVKKSRPVSSEEVCLKIRELLPAYVIGALDADDLDWMRSNMDNCPSVQAEIAQYAAIAAGFLDRIPPAQPPAGLREKIMTSLRRST